jgi:large subunit ribosomal protein L17
MRHRVSGRKFNRTRAHRQAMFRNAAQSLFEHGQIVTTVEKAKDVRRFAEKLITLAKKARGGSLAARQRIISVLNDRAVIPSDRQEDYDVMTDGQRRKAVRSPSGRRWRAGGPKLGMEFTAESIVHRLIDSVAPRFEDRPGGYTRIIRLGRSRIGDNATRAILQLVGEEEAVGSVARRGPNARKTKGEARRKFLEQTLKKGSAQPQAGPQAGDADQNSEGTAP